ncbi:hypothetical protein [uncultured Lactobacillus sp.]|uniref:hypothetical protein n=1 Tax=uncultured Lactobacillus sp. TaxID=153152 RepID=UPI00262F8E0F|nr:hypothetical protein [uncultured Lactobacillus sp.]
MKFFAIGLGIGSAIGVAVSFLPNAKNNGRVKDDVKNWVDDTSNEVKTLSIGSKQALESSNELADELPQAQKTLTSLKNDLSNFQVSIKPNIEAIKSELNQTLSSVDKIKKI